MIAYTRVVCAACFIIATASAADLQPILHDQGVDPARAALLIVRLEDGAEWSAGGPRIEQRFAPASTSKIPHTLIALETGLAEGPDEAFEWDGVKRPFESWNQDQTMHSAYQRSAVWVYQRIAATLGAETMAKWLKAFDYGDADVGGPEDVTMYWLRGPLAISAREQTAFLARLAKQELPLSGQTYLHGKRIMKMEAGQDWALYAKTGWRFRRDDVDTGWFVGWVETKRNGAAETYVFAFNMDMPIPDQDLPKRLSVPKAALVEIGALPRADKD